MADTELASAENDPILMVLAAGHPSGMTIHCSNYIRYLLKLCQINDGLYGLSVS